MTKSRTMRAAVLLLALTLITSCFVGGTFAKYVTSADSVQTARVAKWGVTITSSGDTFANSYTGTDGSANTVVSSTTEKVVAPGTEGVLAKSTITGTPEVAVNVTYSAVLTLENWTYDNADYCPIVFKVDNTEHKIDGTDITTIDGLITAVEAAIASHSKTYEAKTNLADPDNNAETTAGADTLAVSWSWPFYVDDATDVKDTALGDAAAADTSVPKITLSVTTTVTQID